MSIDQFNSEIDQAMEDSKKGRITSAIELQKMAKQWR
jgi:hypothetical protein